jgi:hypothetical protein
MNPDHPSNPTDLPTCVAIRYVLRVQEKHTPNTATFLLPRSGCQKKSAPFGSPLKKLP